MGNFAENLNLGNRFRPPRVCSKQLLLPILLIHIKCSSIDLHISELWLFQQYFHFKLVAIKLQIYKKNGAWSSD